MRAHCIVLYVVFDKDFTAQILCCCFLFLGSLNISYCHVLIFSFFLLWKNEPNTDIYLHSASTSFTAVIIALIFCHKL